MNKEIKDRWIAALRSGDYKQGKDQLRNFDNRFCCLGVLCDLNDPHQWIKSSVYNPHYSYLRYYGNLPPQMQTKFNISPVEVNKLMRMNDNGVDFKEIANHIEVNL